MANLNGSDPLVNTPTTPTAGRVAPNGRISKRVIEFQPTLRKELLKTEENTVLSLLREAYNLSGGLYFGDCLTHTRLALNHAKKQMISNCVIYQGRVFDDKGIESDHTYALTLNGEIFWKASPDSYFLLSKVPEVHVELEKSEISTHIKTLRQLLYLDEKTPLSIWIHTNDNIKLLTTHREKSSVVYYPLDQLPDDSDSEASISYLAPGNKRMCLTLKLDKASTPAARVTLKEGDNRPRELILNIKPDSITFSCPSDPSFVLSGPATHPPPPPADQAETEDAWKHSTIKKVPFEVTLLLMHWEVISPKPDDFETTLKRHWTQKLAS